jgi:peflin
LFLHQEWKKVFDRYDLDRSGTIDVEEIRLAFGGMNYTFTLDFCTMLCRRFSLRSAGQINLDAFIYACGMACHLIMLENTGTD